MKFQVHQLPTGGTQYTFWCPGCRDTHHYLVGAEGRPSWGFNGNLDRPTFTPSLLVKCGHYAGRHSPGDPCWCNYEERYGKSAPFACYICHLYLTDGRLQFLGDCTHALAGQTVDLPEFPEKP